MIPLIFLYYEYIDGPKLSEQKKPIWVYSSSPHKWGRNNWFWMNWLFRDGSVGSSLLDQFRGNYFDERKTELQWGNSKSVVGESQYFDILVGHLNCKQSLCNVNCALAAFTFNWYCQLCTFIQILAVHGGFIVLLFLTVVELVRFWTKLLFLTLSRFWTKLLFLRNN